MSRFFTNPVWLTSRDVRLIEVTDDNRLLTHLKDGTVCPSGMQYDHGIPDGALKRALQAVRRGSWTEVTPWPAPPPDLNFDVPDNAGEAW